jgi:ATP-dependent helicase/nuclease subunit A
VDRVPVAELIQRVLAFTDYRAILAGNSSRLWRNLDKLLADARASQVVQVEAFLEYLKTLKDAGVREGEAAADAEGAVRLMSIHKSKGLEFGVVVLADAARQGPTQGDPVYLQPGSGLAFKPDRVDELPLAYRYAQWLDRDQSEAETQRLLYVALTRAKEKVIVSGHLTGNDDKLETRGWLKDLLASLPVDLPALAKDPGAWQSVALPCGQPVGVWLAPPGERVEAAEAPAQAWPTSTALPLFQPLVLVEDAPAGETDLPEAAEDDFAWRVSGPDPRRCARAVGQMAHRALQNWRFPGDPGLAGLLAAAAFEHGLADPGERARAQAEAETLLSRFRAHPLWLEMDRAARRLHEVPYTLRRRDGRVENGYLDVLYQTEAGWQLVDFKTDRVENQLELGLLTARYANQLRRYVHAVRELVGSLVQARLVFLDDRGQVSVIDPLA